MGNQAAQLKSCIAHCIYILKIDEHSAPSTRVIKDRDRKGTHRISILKAEYVKD